MTKRGGSPAQGRRGAESEAVLRAKYLDYCSAQVAEILLLLSPDEIYLLARDAARESGRSEDLTYEESVRLATERISRKLALPPFEVWAEDYRSHPELYDEFLLGLWEGDERRPDA